MAAAMAADADAAAAPTPVTVFTGFLGSGKTTIIMSMLKQLPADHGIALLKNEFGDVAVDSVLASDSSVVVREMLNGCLCCVLVGQMENGLREIREQYKPKHIIVEASGSAFPAAIAWQIRQLEGFRLDAIVTVVDCVNFAGYADRSPTAKMQAQYTDLILLNKHDLVDERQLDLVIDRVNDLNTDTPRIRTHGKDGVSPDLILGITPSFSRSLTTGPLSGDTQHMAREVDLITVRAASPSASADDLHALFGKLPGDRFFRIKGILTEHGSTVVFNYAFGRRGGVQLATALPADSVRLQLVFMGDELARYVGQIREAIGDANATVTFSPRHDDEDHHHH